MRKKSPKIQIEFEDKTPQKSKSNQFKMKKKIALETFKRIQAWRRTHEAPVDTMGCFDQKLDPKLDINEAAFINIIAVLLSVQSRDESTYKVVSHLKEDGISIDKYYNLSEDEIKEKIKSINFTNSKAHYIKEAAKTIKDKWKGVVPKNLKGITELKGVGAKVGNLVLQETFGVVEGIAVDLHVHRISNRIGWVDTKKPDDTMKELNELFDKEHWVKVNHDLVGLGQILCKKTNPKCEDCPALLNCDFGGKQIQKESKKKRGKEVVKKNDGDDDVTKKRDRLSKMGSLYE